MQFGSSQKRSLFTAAALGLVPDLVISLAVASATDSGVIGFFATLIGLQVLYFLIWAKNAIWGWLMFWATGRKQLAEHLFDYLRSNGYPEPNDYQEDVESYLSDVMGNEEQPVDVRLKAAIEIGSLSMLAAYRHMSQLMKTHLAYEEAIRQYKRTFPPKAYD